jgi:hypothetical protein
MKSLKVLILFLIINTAFGQDNVQVGGSYPEVEASEKYYFSKGDELLTIKVDEKKITIQKLSTDHLNLNTTKEYEDFPRGFRLEKITKFKSKIYVFYSLLNKEKIVEQLFAREIDFASGTFLNNGKIVLKTKGKVTGISQFTGKYDFYFSADSSKMIVNYRRLPEYKANYKNNDIVGLYTFNEQLIQESDREVKMPFTESKMDFLTFSVDKDNYVYMAVKVFEGNKEALFMDDSIAGYKIQILKVFPRSKEVSIIPLDIKEKIIKSIFIHENPQGYMDCTGFYNFSKKTSSADGLFLFKLMQDESVMEAGIYEIPVEVLSLYNSWWNQKQNERREDDDKAEFKNLLMKEVVSEKDGSLILIGEQYSMYTSYQPVGPTGASRSKPVYHYDNMLITKIDPYGKVAWMKKLPKKQVGHSGKGGMSYKYLRSGSNHCFLFLDNIKNRNLATNETPAIHLDGAGGFLAIYKIEDTSGGMEKKMILDTRDINGIVIGDFQPSGICPVNAQQFVVEVKKGKKEEVLIKARL